MHKFSLLSVQITNFSQILEWTYKHVCDILMYPKSYLSLATYIHMYVTHKLMQLEKCPFRRSMFGPPS